MFIAETKNFIFTRVSKVDVDGEAQQDIKTQAPLICSKFNLNIDKCIVIEDKGSAYDQKKFKNRTGFIEILNSIVGKVTIVDFFLKNYEKQNINIYIFDYNRLFRSIEYGLLFAIICVGFGVKVYSVNQDNLNPKKDEQIGEKIGRYIRIAMYSFLAEGYSKNISDSVKKSFRKVGEITYSVDGNRVGKKFKDLNGNKIDLCQEKMEVLYSFIEDKIIYYGKKNIKSYYNKLIKAVAKEFNVSISKSFLTKYKKKIEKSQLIIK